LGNSRASRRGSHVQLDVDVAHFEILPTAGADDRAIGHVQASTEIKVLVIDGAGETFCAGDDITEMHTWGNPTASFAPGPRLPGAC
jgi:hypothetical protein